MHLHVNLCKAVLAFVPLALAVAWLGSSALLSWYLANFTNYDAPTNYDATYGSLGTAIGMMMRMWISSIVILVGAEHKGSEPLNHPWRGSTVRNNPFSGTPSPQSVMTSSLMG
jgi:Virulence factor BrkB